MMKNAFSVVTISYFGIRLLCVQKNAFHEEKKLFFFRDWLFSHDFLCTIAKPALIPR